MNIGIISIRYATALLRYCESTGGAERVCGQVRRLLAGKESSPVVLEPELERFTRLLVRHGRMDCARFILSSFVSMYFKSRGELEAYLITGHHAPCGPCVEAQDDTRAPFGCKVHFETQVDESLIGGFIVQIDSEYVLDASVRSQLESVRQCSLLIQNNRIVRKYPMANNTIKASEISEILLDELKGIDSSLKYEEIGKVHTVSDGVAHIFGLINARPASCSSSTAA